MRNIKLVIVSSGIVLASAAAVSAATIVRAHTNDVSGFVSANDGNGTMVTVSAFRSGAQDSPVGGQLGQATGFLFYEVDKCNISTGTCTILRGSGNVLSSSIGGGSQNVNVNVNTASVTGYTNEICSGSGCTFDTGNTICSTVTCSAASGGSVNLTFSARTVGGFSESTAGTTQVTFASTSLKINGSSNIAAANVTGTVLGTAVPSGGFAEIQTLHQAVITITKN